MNAAGRAGVRGAEFRTVLFVFLAFGTFAVLSWESFGSDGGPSFFYPAAGVTVAAMMLSRRVVWPWICLAVVVAEILVDTHYGSTLRVAVQFAAANVVEPLIGASLVLAWCGGRPDLRERRDFVGFLVGACLIAPVIPALIGGHAIAGDGGPPWQGAALTWWAGDAVGVLVMASPILLWPDQAGVLRRRPWETAAALLVTGGLSVGSFWSDLPPSVLVLPVLAWAAFRLDMLGAAAAGAVAAFLANIMTTRGEGLFASEQVSPENQVVLVQIYIAVIVVVAMLIAQEAGARLRAVRERDVERRERVRLETLSMLAHRLSAALTPKDIGEALLDHVLDEGGAQAVNLGLVSSDGERLEWITTSGYPPPLLDRFGDGTPLGQRSVANDVVRFGTPIDLRTAQQYAQAYPALAQWPVDAGAETIVGRPLECGGDPFGALVLVWTEAQPLDTAQLAYISAVATMVSQALVRARVYADEHARAAVLHSVAQPLAQVDAAGLHYRALYRSANTAHGLGGDWYSVLNLDGRRTYLAVGDVLGHGLTAVEDMAQLRSAGNAYAHLGLMPARVLAELDRLANRVSRAEFATSAVAVFDPGTGVLTYSSAGHPPPLLRSAATGAVIRLDAARGPVLGLLDDVGYSESTVQVADGDVLVMYSDGLVEHDEYDIQAGITHLERVIANWPPDALLDCEALAEDVAPTPHTDDLCLVVVRFGAARPG